MDDVKGDPSTGVTNSNDGVRMMIQSRARRRRRQHRAGMPTDRAWATAWPLAATTRSTRDHHGGGWQLRVCQRVVGYSIYFNFNKDGYCTAALCDAGCVSEEINVELELDPIIPTDVSGSVHDDTGKAIEGAYVEFIFSGGSNGGGVMPPVMDLGGWAADGTETRDNVGAPPPPNMPGSTGAESGGADWDDFAGAPAMGAPATLGNAGSGANSGCRSSAPIAGHLGTAACRFRRLLRVTDAAATSNLPTSRRPVLLIITLQAPPFSGEFSAMKRRMMPTEPRADSSHLVGYRHD